MVKRANRERKIRCIFGSNAEGKGSSLADQNLISEESWKRGCNTRHVPPSRETGRSNSVWKIKWIQAAVSALA